MSACTDPAHPFYCSGDDFVIAARRSTCVASPRECLDATKIADYTASLTAKGAVTVRQCGSGKKRCADGSCAAEGSACSGIDPCSSNSALPISCGDGVTCQRSKVECRKKVKLFGCEPGMVKCGGVRFLCAATQAACSAKTGCTDPTHKVCGFSRATPKARPGPSCAGRLAVCRPHGAPSFWELPLGLHRYQRRTCG